MGKPKSTSSFAPKPGTSGVGDEGTSGSSNKRTSVKPAGGPPGDLMTNLMAAIRNRPNLRKVAEPETDLNATLKRRTSEAKPAPISTVGAKSGGASGRLDVNAIFERAFAVRKANRAQDSDEDDDDESKDWSTEEE